MTRSKSKKLSVSSNTIDLIEEDLNQDKENKYLDKDEANKDVDDIEKDEDDDDIKEDEADDHVIQEDEEEVETISRKAITPLDPDLLHSGGELSWWLKFHCDQHVINHELMDETYD